MLIIFLFPPLTGFSISKWLDDQQDAIAIAKTKYAVPSAFELFRIYGTRLTVSG